MVFQIEVNMLPIAIPILSHPIEVDNMMLLVEDELDKVHSMRNYNILDFQCIGYFQRRVQLLMHT